MIKKRVWFFLIIAMCCAPLASKAGPTSDPELSRLIIYDTRGSDAEETVLIFDHHSNYTKVWMKNYLGARQGEVPSRHYLAAFNVLRSIPEFALKPEYRGKNLREHAARGTLTLAWQDATGKHIKTIKYYAPEHTLDDFRSAFNSAWALSRYAILSLSSFESDNAGIREDALYFLSGSGWLTLDELTDVVAYHQQKGNIPKLSRALWAALDNTYSPSSEFQNVHYLEYCVRKGIGHLGPAALSAIPQPISASRKSALFRQIRQDLQTAP